LQLTTKLWYHEATDVDEASTVLIVDDQPALHQALGELLAVEGYILGHANDGPGALDLVQEMIPDLILLDVKMPGMDGFEVCRRLRANPRLAEVPVVMLTALADSESRLQGIQAGADDFVSKPFDATELLAKVRTITRLNRYRRLLQERSRREEAEEEVARHRRDLQRLSIQLIKAQEAERARLSRELHDELGQSLTAVSLNLAEVIKELSPDAMPRIREKLVEARTLTDQALAQVRRLSLDLRPGILDDLGLIATLRWYLNRWNRTFEIEVEFRAMDLEQRLPPDIETALYRIVQEATTNVAKHAQASKVRVSLEHKPAAIVALIEDNGCGFAAEGISMRETPGPGAGLLGMRERVGLLRGTFDLWSSPGKGTRLCVKIPLPE
jgi:signal transduction histidine kinase